MGFPVGYTELFLPKLFIHTLSLLGFLRKFISLIFSYLGLQDFIEPDFHSPNNNHHHSSHALSFWPDPTRTPETQSLSAVLIRELLPVVRFSELREGSAAEAESCAVCLYEFEGEDEIRRLRNCCHIFHRGCLDRWIGYDQRTCPLCRSPLIEATEDLQLASLNERLWAASAIPDFYSDFSHITGL